MRSPGIGSWPGFAPRFGTLCLLVSGFWSAAVQRSIQIRFWTVISSSGVVSGHEELSQDQCRFWTVMCSYRLFPPAFRPAGGVGDIREQITVTTPGCQRWRTYTSPVDNRKQRNNNQHRTVKEKEKEKKLCETTTKTGQTLKETMSAQSS